MTPWLDPLQEALDESVEPRVFFFRDDDVGLADERLPPLLDLFAHHELAVDLAVVPMALTARGVALLRDRMQISRGQIGVHQHGLSHVNHEPDGRKWEFGPSRSASVQYGDIAEGQRRLADWLGHFSQPIFTPPWNRCTEATGWALRELRFRALSRDGTAPPLGIPGLRELPIQVDWKARRKGVRLSRLEVGKRLAAAAAPTGVMFHHAEMDAEERAAAADLLALLAGHPRARCVSMMQLVETVEPLEPSVEARP